MEIPFSFRDTVDSQNFTGYSKECDDIVSHLRDSKNVVVTSPRKWGKSSLLNKALSALVSSDSSIRICRIGLFNLRDELSFYTLLVQEVLKAVSSSWEDAVENLKCYLPESAADVAVGKSSLDQFRIVLDGRKVADIRDILWRLPERVTSEKGCRMVVMVDEFANVADFADADAFLNRMCCYWADCPGVSFCLSGCRRSLMTGWFGESGTHASFGEFISLGKIDGNDLCTMVKEKFTLSGKYIDDEACSMMVSLVDSHPYYIQQLAQLSWLRTYVVCTSDIVADAYESLLDQLNLVFTSLTETMTDQQIRYINALICGESVLSTSEVLHRYGITSATSASRSKSALLQREIVDMVAGKMTVQDPMYAGWLRKRYFIHR